MAAQVAITFVDETPGVQRREAFRLTLWSETERRSPTRSSFSRFDRRDVLHIRFLCR